MAMRVVFMTCCMCGLRQINARAALAALTALVDTSISLLTCGSVMKSEFEPRSADLATCLLGIASAAALGIVLWAVLEVRSSRTTNDVEQESRLDSTSFWAATEPLEIPPGVPVFAEIPSIADADSRQGEWYVLDSRSRRFHRLGSSGELLGSFGRQGNGPGEFGTMPTAIVVHGDTIVVAERHRNHVHLFSPSGTFIADRMLRFDACTLPEVRDMASSPMGLLLLVTCKHQDMRNEARVILEGRGGLMRVLAKQTPDPDGPVVLDALTPPLLSVHPRGFVFGNAGEKCLRVYDLVGEALDLVCHDWLQPLNPPDEFVDEMRSVFSRRSNVRWTLPERFFPIEAVFVTQDERWIYRVFASNEPIGYELVAPDRGETSLPVPRARYVFVHEGSVLAGWEDLEGTRIAFYPLEDR